MNIRNILELLEDIEDSEPQVGDIVEMECGDTLIETTIAEVTDDGVVLHLDEGGLRILVDGARQLQEGKTGPGLWANIHARRKSGKRMRKKGEQGAPTEKALKAAQAGSKNESVEGVAEGLEEPTSNWKSWDPDNYESGSPEYYSSLSNALLSLVKEKFGGKAWFDGGGYAYLIDVSNPKKLVSSDGADINVPNIARGLEKYTSNFKENVIDVYPSDWPDLFRSSRESPGPESDQEWHELGKMGIDVKENLHRLSGQGVTEGEIDEAKYRGREVPLGKPMAGDVAKSKVYVKGPKGNVVKVNFGQKGVKIKKNNPARRKSFRARHNCKNPGPRWRARYWSCRMW